MKKRMLVMVVAIMVTVTAFVGGTLAWFTDSAELPVSSTYAIGNVSLYDTSAVLLNNMTSGVLLPGTAVYKYDPLAVNPMDPFVAVAQGSEDCYVFIEIVPSFGTGVNAYTVDGVNNVCADDFVDYTVLGNWTLLNGNVYYTVVTNITEDTVLPVYDTISAPASVNKAMIDATNGDTVKLSINTYAIQLAGFENEPETAWNTIYNEYFNVNNTEAQPDEVIIDSTDVTE